jgi:imidazole glycerol-phosphate synthase subunit HisH
MVAIIDYGVGNLASIKNMLKKVGADAIVTSDEETIKKASKIILPGVGAFDTCAQKLNDSGLLSCLNETVVNNKIPVLGICVGMQLLTSGSEEGVLPGLNWIRGRIVKFKTELMPGGYKIPHMGWTDVHTNKKDTGLFKDMYEEPRFYFVHSYHPELEDEKNVLVYAQYGYRFAAGIINGHIMGVQFHPEKSHKFGMKLLENFVKYC